MKGYSLNIIDCSICGECFGVNSLNQDILSVYNSKDCSFEENLKNKEKFLEDKENSLYNLDLFLDSVDDIDEADDIYYADKSIWDYFEKNFDNIYDSVDYIYLSLNCDLVKFLEEHPVLHDKKIVIPEAISIDDYNKLEILCNKYNKFSNIYVKLQGNTGFVNLLECKKIMDEIKCKADFIKSLNLSPLESVMVAYDIVRDRVYQEETSENYMESRDLKEVLFGDKIVCHGYARILQVILDYLGIKNECVILKKNNSHEAHARNGVYINDPKYKVNGYYYLDSTWDSRRKDDTRNNFLYSYKFFMKTINEMNEFEKYNYLRTDIITNFNVIYNNIDNIYENDDLIDANLKLFSLGRKINKLNYKIFAYNKKVFKLQYFNPSVNLFERYKKDDLIGIVKKIEDKYNRPINAETYLNLLYNVRKVENSFDNVKYPNSENALYGIYKMSNWHFEKHHYSYQDAFLKRLFSDSDNCEEKKDFVNCLNEIEAKEKARKNRANRLKVLQKRK